MILINVEGMHCENCKKRILEGLSGLGISCEVSVENKTVSVEETALSQAMELLEDLGFEATCNR